MCNDIPARSNRLCLNPNNLRNVTPTGINFEPLRGSSQALGSVETQWNQHEIHHLGYIFCALFPSHPGQANPRLVFSIFHVHKFVPWTLKYAKNSFKDIGIRYFSGNSTKKVVPFNWKDGCLFWRWVWHIAGMSEEAFPNPDTKNFLQR